MSTFFVHKSTHIIAIIGGSFFVGSVLVYWGFFHQVEQHKTHLNEMREAHARIERNRDTFTALVARLAETSSERESLKKRILSEGKVIDFLTLVERVGKEQQIILKTNNITIRPINKTFETLVVNVTTEGSYVALIKTLTLLEHLPYQSSIHNVQFTSLEKDDVDTWSSTYDIEVTQFKSNEI